MFIYYYNRYLCISNNTTHFSHKVHSHLKYHSILSLHLPCVYYLYENKQLKETAGWERARRQTADTTGN